LVRTRGLQSDERNDFDSYTWETLCNLALSLDKADAISCLEAAVIHLNIDRETEVILGPVVIACSELIERHPEEKEALLAWVNEQLQLLVNQPEEQRQIAPSAAVFFASLNQKDDVLYWLQKATDAKAPLWRERVLHSLVKHYAKKENFTEARLLLDEMQVQDEKDYAIATLAQAMAASYPVEAGFLLHEIHEAYISNESARLLLQQPSMLLAPQGVYQVLLHLQSNPNELASALEIIIERDTVGIVAEAVKQLFIQTQASGPSATVLLELCKHPSIVDFVKPRALEKYKNELQIRANRELSQSVPHLIAEMQNATLLEEDEARELTQLMQKL
jgi:pentatricopeptide repeat protein